MKNKATIHYLMQDSPDYPTIIIKRLGNDAPEKLSFIGNLNLLSLPKTALLLRIKGTVLFIDKK